MKQKAALEADICVIKQESKVAAAEVEVRVLEQGEQEHELPSVYGDKHEEIHNYVQNLHVSEQQTTFISSLSNQQPNFYVSAPSAPQTTNVLTSQPSFPQISNVTNPVFAAVQSQPNFQPSVLQHSMQNDTISPNALLHNAMSDITRFMYRKDFLLSRFVNFDDKPDSYESWRASFQSVTRELGVTPFEEMDLLVKWLGPESCKFAKSIRAANAHDPPRGLQRIYDRLQERYGRPEMVESAMKRKLNLFPTLTNKDNVKLYDLLDILTEIESVMLNPQYATLFSYYNSSSGVIPIVSKLPHFLQEKWTTLASSYKKTHQVSFPPFSFFVRFIRDICEIRNDPAFSHSNYNQSTAS